MKVLVFAFVFMLSLFAFCYPLTKLAVIEAPDGIQIGAGGQLPVKEFDEYVYERGELVLTAGEVRTLNFGSDVTFHGGAHCTAEVLNPQESDANNFLILHVWYDGDVKVKVRNLSNATVTFPNDQIVVACWNTANFRGDSAAKTRNRRVLQN